MHRLTLLLNKRLSLYHETFSSVIVNTVLMSTTYY